MGIIAPPPRLAIQSLDFDGGGQGCADVVLVLALLVLAIAVSTADVTTGGSDFFVTWSNMGTSGQQDVTRFMLTHSAYCYRSSGRPVVSTLTI